MKIQTETKYRCDGCSKETFSPYTHMAEDWSVVGTSDFIITYSQTDAERQRGLARLYVAKAR